MSDPNWITPDWPAPPNVKALVTLRRGGVSQAPFDTFNLAAHLGDDPQAVSKNRQQLINIAKLPGDPIWIKQVHGNTTVDLATISPQTEIPADASVSFNPNQVSVVLTADCLPILLCDEKGTRVAAVHAGWRGLSLGVIESAVQALTAGGSLKSLSPERLIAWLGPAIGPEAFEVGLDVKQAFPEPEAEIAFKPQGQNKWLANLYTLATLRLNRLGITQVFGGDFCTFTDTERFFSFRRSNPTGRMATLIWISPT